MHEEAVVPQETKEGSAPRGFPFSRLAVMRVGLLVAIAAFAVLTPGFLSVPSLTTLLTTTSFVGCIAIAMTFVTLSGNIMSFALGATAAVSAVVFVHVVNVAGYFPAVIAALTAGALISSAQGVLIGGIRANPIIVSIAANVLIYGCAQWLTRNETVHVLDPADTLLLKGKLFGLPVEFVVFVAATIVGQLLLSLTVFGRNLIYIGSGFRAAEAVGLPTVRTTIGAYLWAGLFSAVAGVLLASRFTQANMEFALHYDYDAIAAVLVGGTAIQGGSGSMLRTFVGVIAIGVIQVLLLLHGLREEWRILATGLIVLAVIVLYSNRRRG
jgi:ribose/xylose/arabinose/galactoside ABC-type transport system permease subunit